MRSDIALTALILDTQNPRLEIQPTHRDAVRELFQSDMKKMVRLAEDIVERGTLNPLEKIGVSESPEHAGRYVVREGNRRIAALIALHAPDIVTGAVSSTAEKKIRDLSAKYLRGTPADQVECEILPFDDLKHWITLRHTGVNGGAGIVEWGPTEKSRYLERTGARKALEMQFLDRYVEHTGGDEDEARRAKKVPISNLRRLLESAPVREKFGITVDERGWAHSDYPPEELFKWLRRVIRDLSSGKLKVKNIYTAKDIRAYVDDFADHDLPDPATALKQPIPVEPLGQAQPAPPARPERRKKPKRWSLRDARIHPKHPRLQDIMEELLGVPFEKANIHAVMLRVFLELSVGDFLRRHRVTVPPDKGNQTTLRARVLGTVDHCATKGWLDKKQAGAARKIAGSTKLHSAQTLSDYVHNENLHPSPTDVTALWKSLAPFLSEVHAH